MPEHFPLFFPTDARRAFGSEDYARRIARVAHLGGGSRVLEIAAGSSGIFLAREFGCNVVAADTDERVVESLKERVKAHGLSDRVEAKRVDLNHLPFPEGEFDGILSVGRVPLSLASTLKLRRYLAPKGRLVFTYPVKVGRFPARAALEFWEKKIGEALLYPREVLLTLQKGGFEPEDIQSLNDHEMDDYYRDAEPHLAKLGPEFAAKVKSLREEIDLHRAQGGKSGVALAIAIGRRREPGEKPPVNRDSG